MPIIREPKFWICMGVVVMVLIMLCGSHESGRPSPPHSAPAWTDYGVSGLWSRRVTAGAGGRSDLPTRASSARTLLMQANLAIDTGAYLEGERQQRQATELFQQALGIRHPQTLIARYFLAHTLDLQGRHEDDAVLDRIDADAGRLLKQPSDLTLLARWVRGGHFFVQQQRDNARYWYEEAERLRELMPREDPEWRKRIHAALIFCYQRQRDSKKALELLERMQGPEYSPVKLGFAGWVQQRTQYGIALRDTGNFGKAEEVLQEVRRECQRRSPDKHLIGLVLYQIATVHQRQAHWSQALDAYKASYQMMHQARGPKDIASLEVHAAWVAAEYLASPQVTPSLLNELKRAHDDLADQPGPKLPTAQVAAFYQAAAQCEADHCRGAQPLLDPLSTDSLGAADPDKGWDDALEFLRALNLMDSGHPEAMQRLDKAIAALQEGVSRDKAALARRLQRTAESQDNRP